jgi:hypothetical protein
MIKGEGRGLRVNRDGYLEVTRRGPYRGRFVHRVYMELLIGRPLRSDEEVHLCGNRQCWPPADFHLILMDAPLHHGSDSGRSPYWKRKARLATLTGA